MRKRKETVKVATVSVSDVRVKGLQWKLKVVKVAAVQVTGVGGACRKDIKRSMAVETGRSRQWRCRW